MPATTLAIAAASVLSLARSALAASTLPDIASSLLNAPLWNAARASETALTSPLTLPSTVVMRSDSVLALVDIAPKRCRVGVYDVVKPF
jgi:hypothetical protein